MSGISEDREGDVAGKWVGCLGVKKTSEIHLNRDSSYIGFVTMVLGTFHKVWMTKIKAYAICKSLATPSLD